MGGRPTELLFKKQETFLPSLKNYDLIDDETFFERGLCKILKDGRNWFSFKIADIAAAKEVCNECEVSAECLSYAVTTNQRWGVWGNTDETERLPMITAFNKNQEHLKMAPKIIDLSHGSTNPYKSAASGYTYSIRNTCPFCQGINAILLDGSEYFNHFQRGEFIQMAFPSLTPDERELILNGTHPECWDKAFPEDDDEDFWDADPDEDWLPEDEVS